MRNYDQSTYGDRIADIYDRLHVAWEPAETVETVAALADGGPVLELGVGTGRVALPLAQRGVPVTGVDVSAAMLGRLREKDPDGTVDAVAGDFTDPPVKGPFKVVFMVNSLVQLTSPDDQLRCVRRVGELLEPGGVFVIEEANPAVFTRGGVDVLHLASDEVHLLASQYDPLEQRYVAQHVILRDDTVRLNPMALRLTTTYEFDLMAQVAGMRLRERWADWGRTQPYAATSRSHVSFYELA